MNDNMGRAFRLRFNYAMRVLLSQDRPYIESALKNELGINPLLTEYCSHKRIEDFYDCLDVRYGKRQAVNRWDCGTCYPRRIYLP